MKQAFKIIFGLALIAAGVLWVLSILGVITLEVSTKGWWTLFIIIPSLYGLCVDKHKVGSCIGLGIGILLLLAARDVITWQMMWQLGLALMVICIGLKVIFIKKWDYKGVSEIKTISRDGKEIRRIETSFGKQECSFAGEKFEGADVEASFGGLIVDLRDAEIVGDAFINLNVAFGGATIIVPQGLAVKLATSSAFGGVSDNRRTKVDSGTPSLVINGKVAFGGVELRD